MAKISRPPKITESSTLSKYYTVEGLIRLAESRMFYIVNDLRLDQQSKYCWQCGSHDSSVEDTHCVSCQVEMKMRKFLVSTRWEANQTSNFMEFFEKDIEHPAMLAPFDMFIERNAMMVVYEWDGFEFLLDQASPLSGKEVLKIALLTLGVIAHFHQKGVSLGGIGLHNFLINPNNQEVVFFDPVIHQIHSGPVPVGARSREIPMLAEVLRRLVAVDESDIHALLNRASHGIFSSPYEFGREIEKMLAQFHNPWQDEHASAISDVGLVRVLNEDNWGWAQLTDDIKLYIVADGMGGHDAGEVASSMAVSLLIKECQRRIVPGTSYSIEELEGILGQSFVLANNGIKDFSMTQGSDMGTTMVVALVHFLQGQSKAVIANVGDSRAYLQRAGRLNQVSVDHSLVQRMVEQGQLTPEEIRHHPNSNILMRTVGTERDVMVDTFKVQVQKDDVILLCSDGLWGETEDYDMQKVLNSTTDLRQAALDMMYLAHNGGGKDNVSLVLVRIPS